MRLLHISDIHYQATPHQNRVIASLCKDIAAQEAVDVIVFTGDMAAKGNTNPGDVELILNGFIQPLRNAAGAGVPLVICPGNHDVNLKARGALYQPIFDGIKSPAQADQVAESASASKDSEVWGHLKGFRQLAQSIDALAFADHALYYTKVIAVGGQTIGFASMNSAWTTRGVGNRTMAVCTYLRRFWSVHIQKLVGRM